MLGLKSSRAKIAIRVAVTACLILLLAMSAVGIYFQLSDGSGGKTTPSNTVVNTLEWSVDTWDGESVSDDEWYSGSEFGNRGDYAFTIDSVESFVYFINLVNNATTAAQYNYFAGYTIYLNTNLDMAGYTIDSIGIRTEDGSGKIVTTFQGTFDGGYYTIRNANINGSGLFGSVENATISNIGLYNCNINAPSDSYVGGIVGEAINSDINAVFVRLGEITGANYLGGLVGKYTVTEAGHYISYSFADTTLTFTDSTLSGLVMSGLVGEIVEETGDAATLEYCYYTSGNVPYSLPAGTAEDITLTSNLLRPTSLSDFSSWSYNKDYDATLSKYLWCDYSYKEGSLALSFDYPILNAFNKVFMVGSFYENTVTLDDGTVENVATLSDAFSYAEVGKITEVLTIVDEITVNESVLVPSGTTVWLNASKDTIIYRGEGFEDAVIVVGENAAFGSADETSCEVTIDGNREYVEENGLSSTALVVVAGAYGTELYFNLQNNVNNLDGNGGLIAIYETYTEASKAVASVAKYASTLTGKSYKTPVSRTSATPIRTTISSSTSLSSGTYTGGSTTSYGGGIYATAAATLTSCYIYSNSATNNGGGVYSSADMVIISCYIYSNSSTSYNGGGVYSSSTLTLYGGRLYSNTASRYGGGIYSVGSSLCVGYGTTSYRTYIYKNSSSSAGGGIAYSNSSGTFSIYSYTYIGGYAGTTSLNSSAGNSASSRGGGIYIYAASTVAISNYVYIYYNTANYGGGISTRVSLSLLSSNIYIWRNEATYYAGGIESTVSTTTLSISTSTTSICYNEAGTYGGGVYVSGTLSLTGGSIEYNTASWGGGVYISAGGTATINGSSLSIAYNTSTYGGGVASGGSASLTIKAGSVHHNTASGSGGGIYCTGTATISGGNIYSNTASAHGGGVYATGATVNIGTDSSYTINIYANKATANRGGGVYYSNSSGTLTIGQYAIIGKSGYANTAGTKGGGVAVASATTVYIYGTICYNTASGEGGGVNIESATTTYVGSSTIEPEIYSNTSSKDGGAIYVSGTAVYVYDCYIHDNTSSNGALCVEATENYIMGGEISSNTASYGALYCGAGTTTVGTAPTYSLSITDNSSAGVYVKGYITVSFGAYVTIEDNSGAGILTSIRSDITISNTTISGNGSVGVKTDDYSTLSMSNATISDNGGIGVYVDGGCTATITACTVSGNSGTGIFLNTATTTIQGCTITDNVSSSDAGGICVHGSLTISDTKIYLNQGTTGGGMRIATSSISIPASVSIYSNTATNGGGIYVNSSCDGFVCNATIYNNTATSCGGGIYSSVKGSATFAGEIYSNTAASYGAGIYHSNTGGNITITGSIHDNTFSSTSTTYGGGLYVGYAASVTISGGSIYSHTASYGGGVAILNASSTIANAVTVSASGAIYSNTATYNGGGIWFNSSCSSSTLSLSSGSIYSNTAGKGGGGVYTNNDTTIASGFAIYYNTAAQGGGIYRAGGSTTINATNTRYLGGNTAYKQGNNTYGCGYFTFYYASDSTITVFNYDDISSYSYTTPSGLSYYGYNTTGSPTATSTSSVLLATGTYSSSSKINTCYAVWVGTDTYTTSSKTSTTYTHTFYTASGTSSSTTTTATTTVTYTYTDDTAYFNYKVTAASYAGAVTPTSSSSTSYGTLSYQSKTKTGYNLAGWTSSSTGTSASWTIGSKLPTGNTTWYAVWSRTVIIRGYYTSSAYNQSSATSYCAYNGSISSITVSSTPSSPTSSGYSFVGWTTSSTGTSAATINLTVTCTDATTYYDIYAVWLGTGTHSDTGSDSTTYNHYFYTTSTSSYSSSEQTAKTITTVYTYTNDTIRYNYTFTSNSGYLYSVSASTSSSTSYGSLAYRSASRSGYTFVGWAGSTTSSSSATSASWTSGSKSPTSTTYWYAVWLGTATHSSTSTSSTTLTHTFYTASGTSSSSTTTATTTTVYTYTNDTIRYNCSLAYNSGYLYTVSATSSSSTSYGSLSYPSTPTKDGYYFAGWTSSSTGTSASWTSGSKNPTSSTTWYAVWYRQAVIRGYNASSSYTDGTTATSYCYYNGSISSITASLPSNPTKSSYSFVGWTTSSTGTSAATISTSVTCTGATTYYTIYAVWLGTGTHSDTGYTYPSYTHTFYTASGTSTSTTTSATTTIVYTYTNDTIRYNYTLAYNSGYLYSVSASTSSSTSGYGSLSYPSTPTRDGYYFAGWTSSSTGTSPEWTSGSKNPTSNTTWYAVWYRQAVIRGYNASSSYTDGTTATSYCYYNGSISSITASLPSNPTKSGYSFVGWTTSSTGTSAATISTSVTCTGATTYYTIYAVWLGTGTHSDTSYTYPSYTHTFYTASGTSTSTTTSATTTIVYTYTNDTIRYNYTLAYNSGYLYSVSASTSSSTSGYGSLSYPSTPTRDGYYFAGWTSSSTGTSPEWTSGSKNPTSNTTWYAVWYRQAVIRGYNASSSYTDGTTATSYCAYNGSISSITASLPSNPTKSGYGFAGWSSSGGTTIDLTTSTSSTSVTCSGAITYKSIYAIWYRQAYLVGNYSTTGGGSATTTNGTTATSYCAYNGSISSITCSVPSNAARTDGYGFAGWATSSTTTSTVSTVDVTCSGVTTTSNVYAVWYRQAYLVGNYSTTGGGSATTVNGSTTTSYCYYTGSISSITCSVPSSVSRTDGYGFKGWATSNLSSNSSTATTVSTASVTCTGTTTAGNVFAIWYRCAYALGYYASGSYKSGSSLTMYCGYTGTISTITASLPADPTQYSQYPNSNNSYVFYGWTTSANQPSTSTTTAPTKLSSVTITCTGTTNTASIYAVWSRSLTYYYNATSNTVNGYYAYNTTAEEQTLTASSTCVAGYSFYGYTSTESFDNNTASAPSMTSYSTSITTTAASTTVYQVLSRKLTYYFNGTSGTANRYYMYNASAGASYSITASSSCKSGYEFYGYTTSTSFDNNTTTSPSMLCTSVSVPTTTADTTVYQVIRRAWVFYETSESTSTVYTYYMYNVAADGEWNYTPSSPTLSGYTFYGWTTSANQPGNTSSLPTTVTPTLTTESGTWYAVWTNSNGTRNETETYTHTFYVSSGVKGTVDTTKTTTYSGVTNYYNYSTSKYITSDVGGTASTPTYSALDYVSEGSVITSNVTVQLNGYTLVGWASSSTSTTADWTSGSDTYKPENNTTWHAVWSKTTGDEVGRTETSNLTHKFYTAGGTASSVTTTKSTPYTNVTVYYNYNLTYNTISNDGTAGTPTYSTLAFQAASKEGYNFVGWTSANDGTTAEWESTDGAKTPEGSTTWYAVWSRTAYVVGHVSTSTTINSAEMTATCAYNGTITSITCTSLPADATSSDYNFVGWATSSSANTASSVVTSVAVACSAATGNTADVYAVWSKDWVLNSSETTTDKTYYNYSTTGSQTYTPTSPTLAGYTFYGWSTSANQPESNTQTAPTVVESLTSSEKTTSWYAVWLREWNFTDSISNGTKTITTYYPYNASANASMSVTNTPSSHEEYDFSGWTTSTTGASSSTTGTVSMTVATASWTADWTRKAYTITFTVDSETPYGTISISELTTVTHGSTISAVGNVITITYYDGSTTTVTAMPNEKEPQYSYNFVSWSTTSGTVTGDMEIVATFSRVLNQYEVSIVVDPNADAGNLTDTSVTVDYGTQITASGNILTVGITEITATKKDGYEFNYFTIDGSKVDATAIAVTGDVTVTANFYATINVTLTVDGDSTQTNSYSYTATYNDTLQGYSKTVSSTGSVAIRSGSTIDLAGSSSSSLSSDGYATVWRISVTTNGETTTSSLGSGSISTPGDFESILGSVTSDITIKFTFSYAYEYTSSAAVNGVTVGVSATKDGADSSCNSLIEKGSTLTITVNTSEIADGYDFVGFDYYVDGTSAGSVGANVNNESITSTGSTSSYYTYETKLNITQINLVVKKVVEVSVTATSLSGGSSLTLTGTYSTKVIESDTTSVKLHSGTWIITMSSGTLTEDILESIFTFTTGCTISKDGDDFILTIAEPTE